MLRFWLTASLAFVVPFVGACAVQASDESALGAPEGRAGAAGQNSSGGASSGAGGSSAVGGGAGDNAGGSDSKATPPSEACQACVRSQCLNCPAGAADCDICTVQPWLCDGASVPVDGAALQDCVCQEKCAEDCAELDLCDSAEAGQGGASQNGSLGGSGGAGGSSDAGGTNAGGSSAGGTNTGSAGASGVIAEDCLDGVDNNGDSLADCDDPTCAAACADPCLSPVSISLTEPLSSVSVKGFWKGHANVFTQDCALSPSTGPDIAYILSNDSASAAFIRVVASSPGNVVLSRRQSCQAGSQDIPCQDKLGAGGSEELVQLVGAGKSMVVLVGAADEGATESFSLSAELIVPVCGDGVVTPDEACDNPQDPGCSDCKIIACDDASPIKDGETIVVTQTDAKVSSSLSPSCSKLGSQSSEHIHSIRAAQSGWLQAVLRSKNEADLTLSLWSACGGDGEVACVDAAPGGVGSLERFVRPVAAGELAFIVVDSYSGNAEVDYELFVQTFPAECGDKIVSPTEQCDSPTDSSCDGDCTWKLDGLDEIEPNENIPQATAISSKFFVGKKATIQGKIQQGGDRDVFSIKVEQGGLLQLSTRAPGATDDGCKKEGFIQSPVGVLDSALRLLSLDGQVLAVNDNDSGGGFCSRLSAQISEGTYLVEVSASPSAPAQVFSYLLDVSLPLLRSIMTLFSRVLLGGFLLAGLVACGDDSSLSSSEDLGCFGTCSPSDSAGAGGSGAAGKGPGAAGGNGEFAGGAGSGVTNGGGTSSAGGSGFGQGGSDAAGGSGPPLPAEGPCADCALEKCPSSEVSSCDCAQSLCASACGEFYNNFCATDAGGAGGSGAGGSDPVGGSAGGSGAIEQDCSNGLDDDGNDLVDCSEQSCSTACAKLCELPPLMLTLGEIRPGSLLGHTSTYQAICVNGTPGISVAYQVKAPSDGWLTFSLASGGDVALSVHKSDCIGSGYSYCRNSVGVGGEESLTVEAKKDDVWYAIVTAIDELPGGAFSLATKFEAPVCGDGKVSPGEQCDDGNTLDGDGCSADCQNDTCDSAPALTDVLVSTKSDAPPPAVANGKLEGGSSLLQASCSKLGVTTVERVHSFRAANPGRLEVSVVPKTPGEDLILSVRSSCAPGGELVCSDAVSSEGVERLSLPAEAGQPFYFVVEGSEAGTLGDYELRAQTLPVVCGDGLLVKSVEQCDPNAGEKNCSADCTRLSGDGDSTGSSAVAKFPAEGVAVGRIFPAGDADRFSVEVPSGKSIRLTIQDPTTAPDCTEKRLDSQIEVFDASGLLVAFNDDQEGQGYCSELVLKNPGVYTVQVRSSQRSAPVQVFSYKLAMTVF